MIARLGQLPNLPVRDVQDDFNETPPCSTERSRWPPSSDNRFTSHTSQTLSPLPCPIFSYCYNATMSSNTNVAGPPFAADNHIRRTPPQKVADIVLDTTLNVPVPTSGPIRSLCSFNESHSSSTRVRSWLNPSCEPYHQSPIPSCS